MPLWRPSLLELSDNIEDHLSGTPNGTEDGGVAAIYMLLLPTWTPQSRRPWTALLTSAAFRSAVHSLSTTQTSSNSQVLQHTLMPT